MDQRSLKSQSFSPVTNYLPKLNATIPKKSPKPKIILKRLQSENNENLRESWTSKLLNWRAILEDQKEYRQLITKIEMYNNKMTISKRRRKSPNNKFYM